MTAADALRAAHARIADPATWTTQVYARDATGYGVGPTDPNAVCWCLSGALMCEAYGGGAYDALEHVALTRGYEGVTQLNDKGGHAAVLSALDAAIQRTA